MTTTAIEAPLRRPRRFSVSSFAATVGPLFGLLLVFGVFALLRPQRYLSVNNIQIILMQTAVVGTAALGMTIIIVSGGIDLSVGSTIALVTVVIAMVLHHFAPAGDAPWWATALASLSGIAAAAGVGLLIGLLVTTLRLPPFIATLGLWGAVRGLAKGLANELTVDPGNTPLSKLMTLNTLAPYRPSRAGMNLGEAGNLLLTDLRNACANGKIFGLFSAGVWIMFALAIFVWALLRYTRFGRHVFAIGSNEQTARLCGVRVPTSKVLIYITAGALAGVAGLLHFAYLTVGDSTTANGMELNIIAAVVIGGASLNGGQGTVFGTIVGALLMTTIATGCTIMEWKNWEQDIITGGIIVLASTLDQLRTRRA